MARRDPYNKKDCFLSVEFEGIVTDDFFPSSFGGVMYGETKPKHLGETRPARRRQTFLSGIAASGNSPSETENSTCILPEFWGEMADHHAKVMETSLASFNHFLAEFRTKPEDQYFSRIGMVSHCAAGIAESAKANEEIRKNLQQLGQGRVKASYWGKNTEWVPETPTAADMRMGITSKSLLPTEYDSLNMAQKEECEGILTSYQKKLESARSGFSSGLTEESKMAVRATVASLATGDLSSLGKIESLKGNKE